MNIAVMSLCRDRLEYTQHCFSSLREFAGTNYQHFVLDQGSKDGTREWLLDQDGLDVTVLEENVGIHRGLNILLDTLGPENFDVVVKLDPDCELSMPNTLRDVCELVHDTGCLLSPRILGLRNPPQPYATTTVDDEVLLLTRIIGGIFLAAPAAFYRRFRFNEDAPLWGTDDSFLCDTWQQRGGYVGYVERLTASHYETTEGQWSRYPDYFARTRAEGKAVL